MLQQYRVFFHKSISRRFFSFLRENSSFLEAQLHNEGCSSAEQVLHFSLELRSCNAPALHLFIQLPERKSLGHCSSETVRGKRHFHRPAWCESSWLQPSSCSVRMLLKGRFVTVPPESQVEKGMGWRNLLCVPRHMISCKRNGLSAVPRQWFAF